MLQENFAAQSSQLFHRDNGTFFDIPRLRKAAHDVVVRSSLIQRCAAGDRQAAIGLKAGFYAYVADFQAAIDQKANSSKLPRQPLYDKFGRDMARKTLLKSARNVRLLQKSELDVVFSEAERELLEMQREEWTHWHHWTHDAMALGLDRMELKNAYVVPGVRQLIAAAHADDLVEFFAGSLAATEFMAEELGETLAFNAAYGNLFQQGRMKEHQGKPYWMIVHTVPHVDGPSHADIVLDFARAYNADEGPERIHALVERGLELFGAAASEVEARFCPLPTKVSAQVV
jgi:hypothetical protein